MSLENSVCELIGVLFDVRTVPFGLTMNCLLSVCVFVQNLGSGSRMATSPQLRVSSSDQYASCSSGQAQTLRPSWGCPVLEGHRSSQMGLPCPFPGSTQSSPLKPPRRPCCPTSWPLALDCDISSLPTGWEGQTISGQWHVLQEF